MSQDRKRIINRIRGDVVIEDLCVRLRGIGSSQEVSSQAAAASLDLIRNRNLVTVEDVRSPQMPFWPVLKSSPAPSISPAPTPPQPELSSIMAHVAGIESLLRELLERPSPAHPEVLAAHIRSAQSMNIIPHGLPGSPNLPGIGSPNSSEPMFIPSKIVPESTGPSSIKVRSDEVEKIDLEDGVAALRKLRGKN